MKDMDFYKEEPAPNSGINTYSHLSVTNGELDLIVEIINGCHELQQGSLPGPPPPPSPDPYCQSLLNQNNFPPQQNPQSTSKPVLVPRGTAVSNDLVVLVKKCFPSSVLVCFLPHVKVFCFTPKKSCTRKQGGFV
ncbi:hypothetical protein ILYODFUR_005662 [Ilyodon furcidens]|uniref:Uncharacterized protein n=1 Tax=Ilyodon furcidens TaxID=33524 RepID=A0ABV0SUG8_9TELE